MVRRVRAARGAVNMSLDDFAAAIGMGRQTLIRTENGTRSPRDHELEAMAEVSGLPLGFFLAEDLDVALNGAGEPKLRERVALLESQVTELRAAIVALSADSLRRTREQQERDETDQPEERPEEGD